MAVSPARYYSYNIFSIRDMNAGFPTTLGGMDLSLRITAGDPVFLRDLVHANAVAAMLEVHRAMGHPFVTKELVVSAALRARAVEAAHWAATYTPNLAQRLQNINNRLDTAVARLQKQEEILEVLMAHHENMRVMARNSRGPHNQYKPLQKTTPGNGVFLAKAVSQGLDAVTQRAITVRPNTPPAIGAVPPNFNPDINSYSDRDILNLIVFYNDNFEILPSDALRTRIEKFQRFLTVL
ncbi:hypothetical protein BD779DRAFT_1471205 [Infundibulicybe gibba]|nr:hypothetical protein BD779DRAFT_1471205 [Infundibulicybe gibba]